MGAVLSCCLKNDDYSEEQDPLLQQQQYLQKQQDAEYLKQEEQRRLLELEEQKILKREQELTDIVNNTNDSYVDISMINNGNSTMNESITNQTSGNKENLDDNDEKSQPYKKLTVNEHMSKKEKEAIVRVWNAVIGGYIAQISPSTRVNNNNKKIGPLVVQL